MEGIGGPQGMRSLNTYDYVPGGGDPGRVGGGTYTNPRGDGNSDPTIQVCLLAHAHTHTHTLSEILSQHPRGTHVVTMSALFLP